MGVRNSSKTLRVGVPHEVECKCCDDLSTCKTVWDAPATQVWAKKLSEANVAVLALNHDDMTHIECFSAKELGLDSASPMCGLESGCLQPVMNIVVSSLLMIPVSSQRPQQ